MVIYTVILTNKNLHLVNKLMEEKLKYQNSKTNTS